MSILSSNNARFKITLDYLKQRGFTWPDWYTEEVLQTGLERCEFYYKNLNSDHRLYADLNFVNNSWELDNLCIRPIWNPAFFIQSVSDLSLLEKMWNEKDQRRKLKLRKKIFKQLKPMTPNYN